MIRPAGPIRVPQKPSAPPRAPFPLLSSIAPVLVSVGIWLVTRSPYALVFAVLGPVIAIAGLVDGRVASRRRLRADGRAYAAELEEAEREIDEVHRRERSERLRETPSAREILRDETIVRWRTRGERRSRVVVGLGEAESGIRLDATADEESAELQRNALVLADAPLTADARDGIGVVGPRALARAVVRGYLVQLCNAAEPGAVRFHALPAEGWEWLRGLPHAGASAADDALEVAIVDDGPSRDDARARRAEADVVFVVAPEPEGVPPRCAEIVELVSATRGRRRSASAPARTPELSVHPVTEQEARSYARRSVELATAAGLGSAGRDLPDAVAWAELRMPEGSRGSLSVPIGVGPSGPVEVDLVGDGPHAVVGGTTGSGKSELLSTWVLGLAAVSAPAELGLLLVDFKGGATFEPLRRLPHVVGVITDLDHGGAERALQSLRAEIRHRETVLRDCGAADIGDPAAVGRLGRLVIVVDEFAAMLDGFAELHALFVDIAARGRSLGMHVVLCTQRPAGVIRDSLLANCTLRMSLRVNNRADSTAVVGTDQAAGLPVEPPGRCVVAVPDAPRVTAQIARVRDDDIERIARANAEGPPPRRPWLDPLPSRIELADVPASADAFTLGIRDVPARQAQEPARWRPDRQGSLLVVGAARSGKTTFCRVVAAGTSERWRTEVLADDLERAVDALERWAREAETPSEGGGRGVVVIVDDLDAFLARVDPDYADRCKELLSRILRDGPRAGIWVVATAQRIASGMQALAALFESPILLRTASRQDHLLAGGDGRSWREDRAQGSGVWGGDEVQLAVTERPLPSAPAEEPAPLVVRDGETVIVCAVRPAAALAALASRLPRADVVAVQDVHAGARTEPTVRAAARVIVGGLDAWQANWSLLSSLRTRATLVVEACALSDYRAITRTRALPPYLHRRPGACWRIADDGVVTRARI